MASETGTPPPAESAQLKQCCAQLYDSEAARWLLGESFHPGGLALTEQLAERLRLSPECRVLDIAAGRGASALHLADRFGCEVVGVDLSARAMGEARDVARQRASQSRASFVCADAEHLPFADGSFDALLCECAFCTFPDKPAAAREFARVVRRGGRMGLSDLTRRAALPQALSGLLAWIACIADALPAQEYQRHLAQAGFTLQATEPHDEALVALVRQAEGRMLAAELAVALSRLIPAQFDLAAAKALAREARAAIARGELGYAFILAKR
jgi:ubiquinone/menaquinone biosynthesis C-methylase UbiE